jgi:hypothetical protein
MPSGHSRRVEMADVFDVLTYAGNYIALSQLQAYKYADRSLSHQVAKPKANLLIRHQLTVIKEVVSDESGSQGS